MADPQTPANDEAGVEDESAARLSRRDQDLLGRQNSKLRRKLDDYHDTILKGWQDQSRRADNQDDWWNCYNCVLDNNQFYQGNATLYVPIIHDAIEARATRFDNQLFPNSGRYVEVVSQDGKQPVDIVALVEHYIRRNKLKTQVARPLLINGDVEGQYNLYVDWDEITRHTVTRTRRPTMIQTPDGAQVADPDAEPVEDIDEEEIADAGPGLEVLHDSDVLVLPATARSVEDALERGGFVAILRRWTKADIEKKIDEGEFREDDGKWLLSIVEAGASEGKKGDVRDQAKALNEACGIRAKGGPVTGWEIWHKLPLSEKGYDEDGDRQLCRIWIGPERRALGAKRNPYWNDRCPLLSEPIKKIAGQFKGKSMVELVAEMQWAANDAANEGEDSAHYAAMPMIRVAPNVTAPIILNVGAILRADRDELEMLQFPDLTARQLQRIGAYTTQIFQTLGVNPSMVPQSSGKPKRNQAEIAMEQQVDLLTTSDAVTVLEEGLFTPLCGWMVDLDHQFRDRALTVRKFGVMGKRAEMEDIPPQQNGARYFFKWLGAEAARNAAMMQQQIAGLNVLRGLKPDLMAEGYRLRLGPLIENMSMSMFGAATGSHVIEDKRHQSSLEPQLENELLSEGHEVPVQPLDNDIEHLKAHMQAQRETGDPMGNFKIHMAAHMKQMQAKTAAQAQMAMQNMMAARGGPPQQGRPGPRQGAQPAGPRVAAQQPPGAIRPDSMARAGALVMPRRA